jgi:hemoglobin
MQRICVFLFAVVTTSLLAACSGMQSQHMESKSEASLYQRLGGVEAIKVVIDDFVANVAGDKRINGRFANTNIANLKQRLVEQVCQGSGGPCEYKGKDMVSAHKGMNISEAEFGALVEDLVKALDKNKVPAKEKGELLGILGPMKPAIVGR